MKPNLTVALLVVAAFAARAELRDARQLMKQQQPEKAAEVIQQLMAQQPDDPWLLYNAGVVAYAAKDFKKADAIWQQLAARTLPEKLRDQVWMQIGNVSFRFGEQAEAPAPEEALANWEHSREAYRVVLASRRKDKVTTANLGVVEQKLAKLHLRLAQRLVQEAKKERPTEKAIQKLEAALDHDRTALNLDPNDPEIRREMMKTEQMLAQKYDEKALQEEKRADNALNHPDASAWERKQAAENLTKALADFGEAKTLDKEDKEARQGEQRVQEKLAKLLAQEGRKLHQEAKNEANWAPEQAISKLENALDKFDESLNLKKDQADTQQAQVEAKKDLEQLLEKRGDQLAEQGQQDEQRRPAQAAEEKMTALEHYEEAQALNPDNQRLPPKIDALKKGLPELLNALAQRERDRADQVEAKSIEQAVAHLEKAATSYEMAQEIAPDNQEVGSSRVDLQACKLEYSIVSPK